MKPTTKYLIQRGDAGHQQEVEFEFESETPDQRPMALDVLLQAQDTQMPDLAYRYGCRNGLCGVCTIEVNGKPRLACRTKLRDGDRLSALSTLPVARDLVVKRDSVNKQLRGRLPAKRSDVVTENTNSYAYNSLNRCIECYACLSDCPMHAKNKSGDNRFGNPYALLKLQQVRVDSSASEDDCRRAIDLGLELGMEECLSCKGCKCGVGIDLKKEVIKPLMQEISE